MKPVDSYSVNCDAESIEIALSPLSKNNKKVGNPGLKIDAYLSRSKSAIVVYFSTCLLTTFAVLRFFVNFRRD